MRTLIGFTLVLSLTVAETHAGNRGLSRTGEPWLLVDRLERIRSWFAHWLIDVPSQAAETTSGNESP